MCKRYAFEQLAHARQRALVRTLHTTALVREAERGHPTPRTLWSEFGQRRGD